ncbi:hypothetical protein Tco_0775490, partial [Tanacetum coccineum]
MGTKDHPLREIIGDLGRPGFAPTTNPEQPSSATMMPFSHQSEPKKYKDALKLKHVGLSYTNLTTLVTTKKALYEMKQAPLRVEGKELLLVQIYVDDIIFAASTPELCDLFAKIMCSKFKMSMMVDTPMVEKSKLDEDKERELCRSITLKIVARPTEKHLNAVKRIFRYLKGSVLRGLWYPKDSSFALIAFADEDHARMSRYTSEHIWQYTTFGDRPCELSVKKTEKRSRLKSSSEAEYIALFVVVAQFLWMRSQLTELWALDSIKFPINSFLNRILEISKEDQIALDDALVAPANRLKIGKCNLRLSSDVTSKEATLQVVYDVLKLTPFYKAFQVSADVPEIYMQEFWASAYIHNRSVRFKMNNKKHILNLDQFRDILQICPKVGNEKFEEPPLEKEILAFLASLGHSGEIRKITDVNVNKLHQPWRSFAAIINKCLSGKTSYDSLRLSQAQILWGMYNNKKVDYAYLLWEDFIYQIENKNTKKGNAMYYPRFTKLIVNFVMAKDPSIPRRNKVNWHYARDDPMFTTINVISRNEDTQLYGTILPAELTNEDIRNSESYKEYYAIASGKIPPKTKASKKKADSDATTKQKPPTVPKEKKGKKTGKGKQKAKELETISEAILTEAEQLKIITKRSRKETHSSHASGSGADEGTGVSPGVPDAPDYDSDDDISWKSSEDDQDEDKNEDDENVQDDDDDAKSGDDELKSQDDQDDDDEAQTESEDDGDDFIHPKLTTHDDETTHEEET